MTEDRVVSREGKSRWYYVGVNHHGWFAGAMVKGKRAAEDAADRMLDHSRAQCATIGPRTDRTTPFDPLATVQSACPDFSEVK